MPTTIRSQSTTRTAVNGAAMAAMLAAGIGAFAMGVFVILNEAGVFAANPIVNRMLPGLSQGAGPWPIAVAGQSMSSILDSSDGFGPAPGELGQLLIAADHLQVVQRPDLGPVIRHTDKSEMLQVKRVEQPADHRNRLRVGAVEGHALLDRSAPGHAGQHDPD